MREERIDQDAASQDESQTPTLQVPAHVSDSKTTNSSDDAVPPPLDELDFEENSVGRRKSPKSPSFAPRRYFRYAIGLWLTEFLLVICLKHFGVLEQEFRLEDVVTQQVLPRINDSIPLPTMLQDKKRPGYLLAQQGATANYPVVMIPGFVTSGLEVWSGHECAKKFFRQRLWAALTGARTFLMERDCWREHMMLDPLTGGDPSGISLRASQGFEAADYFFGNYWVWSKLIRNLADVGYTPSTMTMEPYDWRLSFPMLEQRDGYLTKLRYKIEALHKTTGKKVVIASHSMGALVVHYFFAWVTTPENKGGGGGGRDWVDKHVHTYINISGSHLGVPKAASALLSGEMRDTVFTGTMGNMAEQFFGRRRRRDLWNTWGSLYAMLPKGGNALFGIGADMCSSSRSEDDPFCRPDELSPLITMSVDNDTTQTVESPTDDQRTAHDASTSDKLTGDFVTKENHSVEGVLDFLQKYGAGLGPQTAAFRDFSLFGSERDSSRVWHDPTRTPLPYAPKMKIFCFYGVGRDTERAYYYRKNEDNAEQEQQLDTPNPPVVLDSSAQNSDLNTEFGIRYVDGDGSVPLLSLGYFCADAWQRPNSELNGSRIKVLTREYRDVSEFCVDDPMRGGPGSSDHVDILGNLDMTEDFLRVVTDFELDKVAKNKIVSNIHQIAKEINSHPNGGIHKGKMEWTDWLL